MKRRTFIQSLAALVSLPATPALSMGSATAVAPAATAVPAQARFWSIYMSALHGDCPPHALQAMTNISATDAKRYVTQLIAEGVIKPNPLMQNSVSKVLKTKDDGLLEKVKKRSEMKSQANSNEVKIAEAVEATDDLDDEVETLDALDGMDQEELVEDKCLENCETEETKLSQQTVE
jgi:hypothetical protein